MNEIDSNAILGENVSLGDGNRIDAGCQIADGAVLGSNNQLWTNVSIGPGTTIGDDNAIHMGSVIGHEPQDTAYDGARSFTRIGNRNILREYLTVHRGTKPESTTVIGDDNLIMGHVHIAHNCAIGSRTNIVNNSLLAGYVQLEDGAFVSGLVAIHQFVRIGQLAMLSGVSAFTKDVPPYMIGAGRRGTVHGLNAVGLRRAGISVASRREIRRAYRLLYREGLNPEDALAQIEQQCQSEEVRHLAEFVRSSERGICGAAAQADDAESDD